MNYTALVVTYNSRRRVPPLFTALRAQVVPPEKIVVVDNASTDGTVEYLQGLGISGLEVIRHAENLGGAGGFHSGLSYFLGTGLPYVWAFDDDAVPTHPDCAKRLLQLMKHHDLQVGGALVLDEADACKAAFEYQTGRGATTDVETIGMTEMIQNDVKFFNGVMLSREVILNCGLPRPELFFRGDETEYRMRIRDRGYAMATFTETRVSHPSSANDYFTFMNSRMWYCRSRGKRYFTYRNRALLLAERGRLATVVREAARYVLFNALVTRDGGAIVDCMRAYWDGARKKTETRNAAHYKMLCSNR